MKKRLTFTFGIIALLGLVGCEREPERVTTQPTPNATMSPRLEASSRQSLPTTPNAGDTSAQIAAAGLIPSQSPEQRLQQVERGRANPFEPLLSQPLAPPVQPPPKKAKAPLVPPQSLPRPVSVNDGSPSPNLALPPQVMPAPVEAQGVYVTGIIELAKSPVAIVQVLGEASEQSVAVGSRLAAGLVEVVAVNARTQTVTLKQYGQLVSRKLGDAPASTSVATSGPQL